MSFNANIDTLKASIARRGGVARQNKFAVYMNRPQGNGILGNLNLGDVLGNVARTAISGGSVSAKSFFNDPRDMALFCEQVSIPGKSIATQERYDDLKPTKQPYGIINDNVTMVFTLTNDYYPYKYLKGWQDLVIRGNQGDGYTVGYKQEYVSQITIQQLSSTDYVPVYGVNLINAYPVAINAIELSNGAENAYTRVSVDFAYDYWEESSLVDGSITAIKEGLGSAIVSNISNIF